MVFCGEPRQQAASRQQSPGIEKLWTSSFCGDGSWGDAQCWLRPTANAQQGLERRSQGCAHLGAHVWTHVRVGTCGAWTHAPGHQKYARAHTLQHTPFGLCCCTPRHTCVDRYTYCWMCWHALLWTHAYPARAHTHTFAPTWDVTSTCLLSICAFSDT